MINEKTIINEKTKNIEREDKTMINEKTKIIKNGVDTIKLVTNNFNCIVELNDLSKYGFLCKTSEKKDRSMSVWYEKIKKTDKGVRLYDISICPNSNRLSIECSIPKYLSKSDNMQLADKEQLKTFMEDLQKELEENNGILVKICDMNITRLDITNMAEMDNDVPLYCTQLLHHLPCKGVKPNKIYKYPAGINWCSKNKCYSIYDKTYEKSNETTTSNLMRCEKRVKKPKLIKTKYGIETFNDLLEHFDEVMIKANKMIQEDIFNYKNKAKLDNTIILPTSTLESTIKFLKEYNKDSTKKGVKTVNDLFITFGVKTLIKEYGKEALLEKLNNEILEGLIKDKKSTQKHKIKAKFNKLINDYLLRFDEKDTIKTGDLYDEIYEKLIA